MRRLLRDSLLRLALRADPRREVVLPLEAARLLRVLPAAGAAGLARDLLQAVAVLPLPDWSAPAQPDSYPRLPAVLVPEAELARAKPTRTRL